MADMKDQAYEKMQNESQKKISELKRKSEDTVKSLLTDFKDDMNTVETTHKNM